MNKIGDFIIDIKEKPKFKEVILVEGLPGIGQVGEIGVKHLIKHLNAKKFGSIYSYAFPPQVIIKKEGVIELVENEFYYHSKGSGKGIIFSTGNTQSSTTRGQHMLCEHMLNITEEFNVKKIYTIGGFGIGVIPSKPRVYAAVTNPDDIAELKEHGIVLERTGIGNIIGASGILLALGKLRGIDGACLMGETSGFYPDPKSAKAVLAVLIKLLDVKVELKELEEKAKEFEKMTEEAKDLEKRILGEMGLGGKPEMPVPEKDQLRYIG